MMPHVLNMTTILPTTKAYQTCTRTGDSKRKRMRRQSEGSRKEAREGLRRILITLTRSSSPAGSQGPREEVLQMIKIPQAPPLKILISISGTLIRQEDKAGP